MAIDASQAVFQHYKSGVIDGSACGTNLDHAVLLVGFDGKAWRLKNSWGISWGEQGMFRLAVDVAAGRRASAGSMSRRPSLASREARPRRSRL